MQDIIQKVIKSKYKYYSTEYDGKYLIIQLVKLEEKEFYEVTICEKFEILAYDVNGKIKTKY